MVRNHREEGIPLEAILFDFGGVIAEEGFREGLKEIARRNDLDPEAFYRLGTDAVYDSGYVVGQANEKAFWELLCARSGLSRYDQAYTEIILEKFQVRPAMLQMVRELKERDVKVAILSDQTDWLDRLEARHHFFSRFDRVFNSFHLGLSKRDPEIFDHAVTKLGVAREWTLFVDDNEGHIERAAARGLRTLHFDELRESLARLEVLLSISGSPV